MTCNSHGTCKRSKDRNSLLCTCENDWIGEWCQFKSTSELLFVKIIIGKLIYSPACAQDDKLGCKHGQCYYRDGMTKCYCKEGFSGALCEGMFYCCDLFCGQQLHILSLDELCDPNEDQCNDGDTCIKNVCMPK